MILFLVAAGQGIFLATMLFISKGANKTANLILGLFLLLFSLNMLENVAYWTNYQYEIPHVIGATRGFVFLFGPLLWLYARRLLSANGSLKWSDAWHFIPFVIYTARRLEFYLLDADLKRELVLNHVPNVFVYRTVEVIICLHMAPYSWYIFKQIHTARAQSDSVVVRMIQSLSVGFALYTISTIVYYVLIEAIDFQPEHDYFISLVGLIAIYQVGYFAFTRPELVHGFVRRETNKPKYEKSPMSEADAEPYITAINELFETEKIYLSNTLRLSDLANRLSISPNYVSQVINAYFGKTFFELVNTYRVEEAKRKLRDPINNDKFLTIALDSGFNNRTSFNNLFKKYTGLSPKEYKAQAQASVLN